jgi:hypothetical protein
MWADWLRNYIPRTKSEFYSQSGIMFRSRTDAKITRHTGDPHSGRIRCVCGTCNSGWMSVIQNQTKPILIPLLKGDRYTLRKRDQAILATWITMFTMVAEFRLRPGELAAISADERKQFMKTQNPLPNWKIWIGAIDDENWKGRYIHTTLPVYSPDDVVKRTENNVPVPNTQTTTFTVNKLYVHVLSSSVVEIDRQKISQRFVQRVWPLLTKTIKWPPRFLMPDDAELIARAFFEGVTKRTIPLSGE